MRPNRKHIVALTTSLAAILMLISGGCSGKGKADGKVDTPADTMQAIEEEPAAPVDIELTSEGVGSVSIGMEIAMIPESVPGVYDAVESESGYGSNSYIFMWDGRSVFTAYEFTEGKIDVVSADSPRVYVKAPDNKELRLGGEFKDVLGLPGVQAEWENADGEGMWCWRWNGIWFQPDQSHLSEELSRELYNDAAEPSASSFTRDVRIGYIGTGLPW